MRTISSNIRMLLIGGAGLLIIVASLLYSNNLATRLLEEEEKRIQLFAAALEVQGDLDAGEDEFLAVIGSIVTENKSIPVVLVDSSSGKAVFAMNFNLGNDISGEDSIKQIQKFIAGIRQSNSPRPIRIENGPQVMFVYYDESPTLTKLRFYPYLQLLIITIFIAILFVGYTIAKRNEQNKVWAGLARETAHQLGTPVSSLLAWSELLQDRVGGSSQKYLDELKKDVLRLQTIADRFSKIGSKPSLKKISLNALLKQGAAYMDKRSPESVQVSLEIPSCEIEILGNEILLEWVIENLMKNALDALPGKGQLKINLAEVQGAYWIEVSDTGKGMSKNMHKAIFKPGFTTKKRGWGLGLSLSKRIIEQYHKGKIFVLHSEPGKGTTFRIVLKKPIQK